MNLKTKTNHNPFLLERIFKIKYANYIIDLRGSFSVLNGKASTDLFEAEIFKVTFISKAEIEHKQMELYMSCNELICECDIAMLKEELGIEIAGDGSLFEIISSTCDFTIQFDQENSFFIESDHVKKGRIEIQKKAS